MRAAWIGVFAAVLGALIGVFGAPHYQQFLEGPKEGVFTAEVSCISEFDIPSALRQQISKYPCSLKVAHIDGPSAKKLSLTIDSEHKLSDVSLIRNDENTSPVLSNGDKSLKLDFTELRKNSVIHINFSSIGNPDLTKKVILAEGRLIDDIPKTEEKEWYTSDYIVIPGVLAFFIAIYAALYWSMSRVIEPLISSASSVRIKMYAAIAASVAVVPFYSNLAMIFVIYALMLIYAELKKLNRDD